MKAEQLIRNLRVLWRADSLIADIKLQHLATKAGLNGFAAIVGAFGLLMLGIAAFFAIEQAWGSIIAALVVGFANLLLSLCLVLVARRLQPNHDIDLALELHKSAIDAIAADAHALEQSFKQTVQHPLDALLPSLLVPLVSSLIQGTKRGLHNAQEETPK